MTVQLCSLNSYYQNYWADEIQEEHWPVSFQPSERLNASKNPSHPEIIFSPLYGIMEVWRPSKKRAPANNSTQLSVDRRYDFFRILLPVISTCHRTFYILSGFDNEWKNKIELAEYLLDFC